jgi:hypothetical protein
LAGAVAIDVVERVRDGWWELASVGGDVRMDLRRGYGDTLRISVNGHRFEEDEPGLQEVFERYPAQFAAVVLVAREAPDLEPGRYLVGSRGIAVMPGVFESAD